MKLIYDANVIISAAFGGKPFWAIQLGAAHSIFMNSAEELRAVIEKLTAKFPVHAAQEARRLINVIIGSAIHSESPKVIKLCRDLSDNKYLDLAKSSRADYLITGDKDLLEILAEDLVKVGLRNLKIVSPKTFIEIAMPVSVR
jgi:putative PIN family toxin of toxin-antitoxin system